jgi:hypothetical protein
MRIGAALVAGAVAGVLLARAPSPRRHDHRLFGGTHAMTTESPSTAVRTHEAFAFTIEAPMAEVAPLFGAEAEKLWAPGWEPRFLWPVVPGDAEGMVFTIAHGDRSAVWVNSRYEPERGNFQYVYVLPDVVATRITIAVEAARDRTHVGVEYDRTALTPEANEVVSRMAAADATAGPEWAAQIETYLARRATGG